MTDPDLTVTICKGYARVPRRLLWKHRWWRFRIGREGRRLDDAACLALHRAFLEGIDGA